MGSVLFFRLNCGGWRWITTLPKKRKKQKLLVKWGHAKS